jgi:hypothetical protein
MLLVIGALLENFVVFIYHEVKSERVPEKLARYE